MSMKPSPVPLSENLQGQTLLKRIRAGESPQDILEELIVEFQVKALAAEPIQSPLQVLYKHGARIATGQKGCPFEALIRKAPKSQVLAFSRLLVDLLFRHDEHPGAAGTFTDRPPEVPLHMLACHSPHTLFIHVAVDASEGVRRCLQQSDQAGRTVSHWLWLDDGLLAQQAAHMRTTPNQIGAEKAWIKTGAAVWKNQALLVRGGASMDIPDSEGITAMDLCLARIASRDALLLPDNELYHRVQPYRAAQTMKEQTHFISPGNTPARPRL